MTRDHYLKTLLFLLLIKALGLFFLVQSNEIGLSPDEAQYFTWSQTPDIGYYSKPPGIAWEIFLGTLFFGNTEWGVRAFSAVVGFLLPLVVYFLGMTCKLSERASFFGSLMMAFSPIGFGASFFATTDGSMVLFWTLATLVILKEKPNYIVLGLLIACGALFKWPIYLFWIFPCFFKRFSTKELFYGMLISLIGLLPSLVWNIKHGFPTFKHVLATVHVPETAANGGNFFEFLGAQALLVSPILFFLFVYACIYCIRHWSTLNEALKFCFFQTLSILVPFLLLSFFKKMQGNWAVFAYPTALILTAYVLIDRQKSEKWVLAGLLLSIALLSATMAVPFLQKRGINIPYRLNAFRHQVGWEALGSSLKEAGYDPSKDFLFADKYQMSSILSFYGENQKRAYFLNLQGIRNNQFSFWPSMQEKELGKTGYFVAVENAPHLQKKSDEIILSYREELKSFCEDTQFLGIKPLYIVNGEVVKAAFLFKCTHYNGHTPKESTLY